ncbi:hypothetical protein RhiJN_10271 [Ceratobasidium sp. AG-Ba]|nr:hypothetical protein RhiJN_10271 [Ceratobasidium sp. AG-Ba]QRW11022.1 hypothetical protein RhiLY_10021 [Ceratobasidium sp. AG-Ba]
MPRIFRHPLDKSRRLLIHFDTKHIPSDALAQLCVTVGQYGGGMTDDPARADILVVDPFHSRAFHEILGSRRPEDRPPVVFGFWISLCVLVRELIWVDHPHWEHIISPYDKKLPAGVLAYGSFLAGRQSMNYIPASQLQSKVSDLVAAAIKNTTESRREVPNAAIISRERISPSSSVGSDDEASINQPPPMPLTAADSSATLLSSDIIPSSTPVISFPDPRGSSGFVHPGGWSDSVVPATPVSLQLLSEKRTTSGLKLSTIGSSKTIARPVASISSKMKSKRKLGPNGLDKASDVDHNVPDLQPSNQETPPGTSNEAAPQNGDTTIDESSNLNTRGTDRPTQLGVSDGRPEPVSHSNDLGSPAVDKTVDPAVQPATPTAPITPPYSEQNSLERFDQDGSIQPPTSNQTDGSAPKITTVDVDFPYLNSSGVDPSAYVLATLDSRSTSEFYLHDNAAPPKQPAPPQTQAVNNEATAPHVSPLEIPSTFSLRPLSAETSASNGTHGQSRKELLKSRTQGSSSLNSSRASTSQPQSNGTIHAAPAPIRAPASRPSNGHSEPATRSSSPSSSEYSDDTRSRSRSHSPSTAAHHAWLAADPPAPPYPPRPVSETEAGPVVRYWDWTEDEDQYIIDYMNWWFDRWPDASTDAILAQIAPNLWHHSRISVFTRFKNKEQKDYMMQVPVLFHRMTNRTSRVNPHSAQTSTSRSGRVIGRGSGPTQTRKRAQIDYRESSDGERRLRRNRDDSDEEPFRERRRSVRTSGHKKPRYTT